MNTRQGRNMKLAYPCRTCDNLTAPDRKTICQRCTLTKNNAKMYPDTLNYYPNGIYWHPLFWYEDIIRVAMLQVNSKFVHRRYGMISEIDGEVIQ